MGFQGWLLSKIDGDFQASFGEIDDSLLGGEVGIDVAFSTVNYKDALALTNRAPVVRQWPLIPGIDGAGTVSESNVDAFNPGDRVLLNGYGVGEVHHGFLAQRAKMKSKWLLRIPESISEKQAMQIGTAGYTAMLCVMALQDHGITPDLGPVLVTGATGGVGCVAVSLLANLGYEVAALTGKAQSHGLLNSLGASQLVDRAAMTEPGKPLQKEVWAAGIDTLGGSTLANLCAQVRYGGAVAACGLAQSPELKTTVMPFILRGVALLGVDSVNAPHERRVAAWRRLAQDLPLDRLALFTREQPLEQAIGVADQIIAGEHTGRTVIRCR